MFTLSWLKLSRIIPFAVNHLMHISIRCLRGYFSRRMDQLRLVELSIQTVHFILAAAGFKIARIGLNISHRGEGRRGEERRGEERRGEERRGEERRGEERRGEERRGEERRGEERRGEERRGEERRGEERRGEERRGEERRGEERRGEERRGEERRGEERRGEERRGEERRGEERRGEERRGEERRGEESDGPAVYCKTKCVGASSMATLCSSSGTEQACSFSFTKYVNNISYFPSSLICGKTMRSLQNGSRLILIARMNQ